MNLHVIELENDIEGEMREKSVTKSVNKVYLRILINLHRYYLKRYRLQVFLFFKSRLSVC